MICFVLWSGDILYTHIYTHTRTHTVVFVDFNNHQLRGVPERKRKRKRKEKEKEKKLRGTADGITAKQQESISQHRIHDTRVTPAKLGDHHINYNMSTTLPHNEWPLTK